MRIQRLALVLTIINSVILISVLILVSRSAALPGVAPVLRGRALEIVDVQGNVRAQIIVAPASSMPDGTSYPETVLLRLIDPNGRPAVKLDASVEGSGLMLSGEAERGDWNGVQVRAEGTGSLLRLLNKDGREEVIQP
jgi:hypothetical protein